MKVNKSCLLNIFENSDDKDEEIFNKKSTDFFKNLKTQEKTRKEILKLNVLEKVQKKKDALMKILGECSYETFKNFLLKAHSNTEMIRMKHLNQDDVNNPSEKDPDWLQARLLKCFGKRVGGSSCGSVIGVNKYSSPNAILKEFLWPSFQGNAACVYGTKNEDLCDDLFLKFNIQRVLKSEIQIINQQKYLLIDVDIKHYGLISHPCTPWIGYSPDGVMIETLRNLNTGNILKKKVLVEYKCPFKHRNLKASSINVTVDDFYRQNAIPFEENKLPIPAYYYSQVQLGIDQCLENFENEAYFVVWIPSFYYSDNDICNVNFKIQKNASNNSIFASNCQGTLQITHVKRNKKFIDDMKSKIKDWYMDKYLPALYLQYYNKLEYNEIQETKSITFNF